MKRLLTIISFLIATISFAQVGIGNTDPHASSLLDVRNGSNNKGILIPRVNIIDLSTAAPVTSPLESLLVYNTNVTTGKGFYYWDNTTSSWVPFSGGINDLSDGKSDVDGSNDGSSVFLGIDAGAADDASNNRNIGIGFKALNAVNGSANDGTGERNIAVGYQALTVNTTGADNVAMGNEAMRYNKTGNHNVAIGDQVLRGAELGAGDSLNNVAVGNNAMKERVSGTKNVAIGNNALTLNLVGDYNVAVGASAGRSNIGQRNVFLGNSAGSDETGDDTLYIDNSSTADPLIYGEFDNDIARVNGTLQISDPTTGGYAFPTADGTADQVLTTDGSGAVTWEDPFALSGSIARVKLISDQTITLANTWTTLNFGAIDFDLDSDFDTVNNYFVVPVDGVYRITAMYTSKANVDNDHNYGIRVSIVGANNIQEVYYRHMDKNSRIVRQVTTLVQLSFDDQIVIQAIASSASTLIIPKKSELTSFSIERVR